MKGLLRSSKLFVKRNASTILTVTGGVGVVATTILAVKATPKALKVLEEAKEEKGEKLTNLEVIQVAGPVYIPAVLTGVGTLTCIFGAHMLSKRQQASLLGAYALLDQSYKEYISKVDELYGEGSSNEIKEEIAKDKYKESEHEYEEPLFYDAFSRQYFNSTIEKVQRAEYYLNREIHMRGWADANEFYEMLGADLIEGGESIGWSEGGNLARYWQGWIDFDHKKITMDDGLECYVISTFQEPYPNFEDDC